jgi:hypothetical protein
MCAGRTICPILLNTPTRCSKDGTKIVFGDGGTPEHHARMKKVSIGTPEHHARMKKRDLSFRDPISATFSRCKWTNSLNVTTPPNVADQKRYCGGAGKCSQTNTKDVTFQISHDWYPQKNGTGNRPCCETEKRRKNTQFSEKARTNAGWSSTILQLFFDFKCPEIVHDGLHLLTTAHVSFHRVTNVRHEPARRRSTVCQPMQPCNKYKNSSQKRESRLCRISTNAEKTEPKWSTALKKITRCTIMVVGCEKRYLKNSAGFGKLWHSKRRNADDEKQNCMPS